MKPNSPTHEEITARAYQIFVERGCPEGRDLEHWLEAEAQLNAAVQQQPQPQSQPQRQSEQQVPLMAKASNSRSSARQPAGRRV